MSRIRSIHPGLFTDEAFVVLSPMSRIFFMGLWTECDDYGSFEWSPLKLKMRLLPADAVDAGELLAEIERERGIIQYEVNGKRYGAVRNFCQYQRPKKPTHTFPQTAEVEAWVNVEARKARDGSEQEGKQLPTGGEESRQMEDGGGDKEGVSDETPKRGRKRAAVAVFEIPDWVPKPEWQAFLRMRKEIKHPITADGIPLAIDRLDKLRQAGNDPATVLNRSTMNSWRGLFKVSGEDDPTPAKVTPIRELTAEEHERMAEHQDTRDARKAAFHRGEAARLRKTVSIGAVLENATQSVRMTQ